jgi:hypothetical protein
MATQQMQLQWNQYSDYARNLGYEIGTFVMFETFYGTKDPLVIATGTSNPEVMKNAKRYFEEAKRDASSLYTVQVGCPLKPVHIG